MEINALYVPIEVAVALFLIGSAVAGFAYRYLLGKISDISSELKGDRESIAKEMKRDKEKLDSDIKKLRETTNEKFSNQDDRFFKLLKEFTNKVPSVDHCDQVQILWKQKLRSSELLKDKEYKRLYEKLEEQGIRLDKLAECIDKLARKKEC